MDAKVIRFPVERRADPGKLERLNYHAALPTTEMFVPAGTNVLSVECSFADVKVTTYEGTGIGCRLRP